MYFYTHHKTVATSILTYINTLVPHELEGVSNRKIFIELLAQFSNGFMGLFRKLTIFPWITGTKGRYVGKIFYVIMSSCNVMFHMYHNGVHPHVATQNIIPEKYMCHALLVP